MAVSPEDRCCEDHDYKPHSQAWYDCVDSQDEAILYNEREYYTADEVYDLRGGATSDYEWYGGYPDAY